MAIKEVKAGEKYTLELLGVGMTQDKFTDGEWGTLELPSGRLVTIRPCDFEALSPANGIKNTETDPKYDPNRKFRKGDKVRVVKWNGRTSMRDGMDAFVVKNEDNGGMVEVSIDGWTNGVFYHACKLELVSPVEEREPYSVVDAHTHWDVADKNMKTVAMYSKGNHPNAKEAAEAERDRLNAEHRKEPK